MPRGAPDHDDPSHHPVSSGASRCHPRSHAVTRGAPDKFSWLVAVPAREVPVIRERYPLPIFG
ncbi:hypothetical protein Ae706Ps2_1307 [Pseudonocardia sp. Ae706_Ps2]|nr:hypothetical protein Ae505Ps2_4207c [Pseudonocardia sp. Ae505_Ps2]OLM22875.1 hypothetical protein Ae706Ps2_1307 [Pseudonocardia sp. Ae706_Ps2]